MQHKINRLLIVIAIAAFGMISAPTLSAMNVVFAASFDPFGQLKSFGLDKLGLDKLGLDKFFDKSKNKADDSNTPKADDSNTPKADDNNNQPKSNDNNQPKSGNSHAGEKCGANGGNTKNWYCKGTHHHCAEGQNDCLLEGGRTK
jgi:hypothetical protein